MPRLSDTMEQGTIGRWLVKEGDSFSEGDVLAEIETDKALMELQAYDAATMLRILVNDGETADLGAPIAIVGDAGEEVAATDGKARAARARGRRAAGGAGAGPRGRAGGRAARAGRARPQRQAGGRHHAQGVADRAQDGRPGRHRPRAAGRARQRPGGADRQGRRGAADRRRRVAAPPAPAPAAPQQAPAARRCGAGRRGRGARPVADAEGGRAADGPVQVDRPPLLRRVRDRHDARDGDALGAERRAGRHAARSSASTT